MPFTDLYKRSIFFEILSIDEDGNPLALEESFAFSMPPSNIEIVQPQRVTKTATPGGYFIDNYGIDGARINISGDTGNYESRLGIFGKQKVARYVTGQDSYFEFRNRILRYSQDSQEYMMRFYDLTHKGTTNIFSRRAQEREEAVRGYTEAWEVVLDESSVKRSSAKPFHYPYSISLTGVRPLGSFNPKGAKAEVGFLSGIQTALTNTVAAIDNFTAQMDVFVSDYYEYAQDVVDILDTAADLTSAIANVGNKIVEYEQKIGGLFGQVLSSTEDVLTAGIQIITFPYNIIKTALDIANNVDSQVQTLAGKVRDNGQDLLDKYTWEKDLDPASEMEEYSRNILIAYNPTVKFGKQSAAYDAVGSVAINGELTLIYGYYEYTVQENTRLDVLARDKLGDPELKDIISAINGVYANDELVVGTTLKIPLTKPNIRFATNDVYAEPGDELDVLGEDIYINPDGSIAVSSTDYVTTSGVDTVLQAIHSRLSEKRGRQVRNAIYGVATQIGNAMDDNAPLEILAVSLEETLVQDPRITEVYDIGYYVEGDKVYQSFKFNTISLETGEYTEGLG